MTNQINLEELYEVYVTLIDDEKKDKLLTAIEMCGLKEKFDEYIKNHSAVRQEDKEYPLKMFEVTLTYSDGLASSMTLFVENYSVAYVMGKYWAFQDDGLKIQVREILNENKLIVMNC